MKTKSSLKKISDRELFEYSNCPENLTEDSVDFDEYDVEEEIDRRIEKGIRIEADPEHCIQCDNPLNSVGECPRGCTDSDSYFFQKGFEKG